MPLPESDHLDLVAAVRAAGRNRLTEPEGLVLAASLGLSVPRVEVVADAAGVGDLDLGGFPGDRVVVKVVAAELGHKSDVGGVAVVEKVPAAVAAAVDSMAEHLAAHGVGPVDGFGIYEHVAHDAGLGGELLVGLRWSAAFGPLVVMGPGGVDAERLAAGGFPPTLLSPLLVDPDPPPGSPDGSPRDVAQHLDAGPFTALLRRPHRGRPPRVAPKVLDDLAVRLLDLARTAVPEPLLEVEFNPVVPTPGGLVALDAVVRLAPEADGGAGVAPAAADAAPPRPLHKIDRLLHPRSVAVVGVSQRLNPGRRILRNLLAAGFPTDRLWVVKEGCGTVDGCPCVPRLEDLPEPVDLLVVAVAAEQVPELVETVLAGRWAESLVLIPGGLGETEGTRRRAAAVARRLAEGRRTAWGGPVINGGNCLGVRSVPGRVDTLFVPRAKLSFPEGEPAPVAVLSQSGAFAIARASQLATLNPAYLVTTGNQLDLSVADYLEHLAERPDLRVFACYVEGFRAGDGARFVEAVARLRRSGRRVVFYLAGRTAEGAAASASHTASVAGDPWAARELAARAGALVADSLEDFDDLVRLCWLLADRPAGGRRLGAVSNAGFECVALADNLGSLALADLEPATRDALADLFRRRRIEGIVEVHNPLDLTPILDDAAFAEAAAAVLDDPGVDLGVVGCVPLTGALATLPASAGHGEEPAADLAETGSVAPRLVELWHRTTKPWVVVVDSGPLYDPLAAHLAAAGLPVFRRADRALRLLGRWAAARR